MRRRRNTKAYDDAAWKKIQKQVLAEETLCPGVSRIEGDNPILCGEKTTEVDHKISVRKAPHLRLVRSNLQALCGRCHKIKTLYRDGALGFDPRKHAIKGADKDGNPIDPKHHWNSE